MRATFTATFMPLRRRDGSICGYAFLDVGDYECLKHHRWSLNQMKKGKNYVRRSAGKSAVYLHREIMDPPKGLEVDHRNNDGLDCRRSNLRVCTHAENHQNRVYGWGRSRHRGVYWVDGRWLAKATVGRRQYTFGRFDTEDEAAEAARAGRARLMPFTTT